MRAIYFLFAIWFGIQTVPTDAAVEFLTGVDRDTITIGDPFVLRLRVHRGAGDQAEIAFGKDFPQPFEIRHTGEVETEQLEDGRVRETQDIILAIYQVGAFRVPPVAVHFVDAEGDSGKIASQPIDVLVQSVRPEGTTDIRDVKPPMVVVAEIPVWFWLVVGGLILLLAGLVWYVYRRRRRPQGRGATAACQLVRGIGQGGAVGADRAGELPAVLFAVVGCFAAVFGSQDARACGGAHDV